MLIQSKKYGNGSYTNIDYKPSYTTYFLVHAMQYLLVVRGLMK